MNPSNPSTTDPKTSEKQPVQAFEDEGEFYEEDDFDYDDEDQYDPHDTAGKFDLPVKNTNMQKKNKVHKKIQDTKVKEEKVDDADEEIIGADGTKTIFKGADKIYHQILWDEKLDKNQFIIGYEDRFEGMKEEHFNMWDTLKEDIPFHRIRYYKRNDEIVWDRKKKINLL